MENFQPWKKSRKNLRQITNEESVAVFKNHIREQAFRYFPGLEPQQTCVELLDTQERATAFLYQFAVCNDVQAHTVFVKVFRRISPNRQPQEVQFKKPILFQKMDAEEKHRLQYTAHKKIYDYFTSLDKEQFGAIRVLDYLPQHNAILTEGANEPSLRKLLLGKKIFFTTRASDDLLPTFQNIGKWLRIYHSMPKKEDVNVRDAYRNDYIASINKLTDFLVKTVGQEAFFRENALTVITKKANEFLPPELPLGLGHGDFALRNIFVGENARVTVFDTSANWRTPIYKDIGFFLNDLKFSPRIISQSIPFGSDQIMAYEHSFLKGYFDNNPIPYAEIRLYETFALLDRWSSAISKSFQKRAFLKIIGQPRIVLINHYSKKRIKNLLAELLKFQALLPEKMQN